MENISFAQKVVNLTNQYRVKNALEPLLINLDLVESAQDHSQNMALQDFYSHTGLDGSRPWERAVAAGYGSTYVGENIAAGYTNPEAVVKGWINSPGHRDNLLNPNYNEIGIGYYFLEQDSGSVNYNSYWTQVLGKSEVGTSEPPSGSKDHLTGLQNEVYRFYNTEINYHFYTSNSFERDFLINNLPQFQYEGAVFKAAAVDREGLVDVYRFYNTEIGNHFFTTSEAERDFVLASLKQYHYEGVAYYVLDANDSLGADIYRFYNTQTGAHFFTPSLAERNFVIENMPLFNYEGSAFEAVSI